MKIICSSNATRAVDRVGAFDNRMTYVLGLQRLGHDVYFMEDVGAERCWDDHYNRVSFQQWKGKDRFERLAKDYGIWPRCCLIYNGGQATHGLSFREAVKIASQADLLINITGKLRTPEIFDNVRYRVYVDMDPGVNQVFHSQHGADRGLQGHDFFFSYGQNLGTSRCDIPTCGVDWVGLFPPVILSQWKVADMKNKGHFTTISSWENKNTFEWKGQFSGDKAQVWRQFADFPRRAGEEIEIALRMPKEYEQDLKLLEQNGWIVSDPTRFTTLQSYQEFIADSRGEFSIANNRYVVFNLGWISDRSVRYLASGRPVLVRSTGIDHLLPSGLGLVTFSTPEEAVEGIHRIERHYSKHCQAARRLAEEYFDSDKVFSKLLQHVNS